MIRVGIGQDSHSFTKEKKLLKLAGIIIKNEAGLEGNSDADVVLHALFNAISQALGNKSIGHYADPLCKKGIIDSKEYLKIALDMCKEKSFVINNIGIMIEAQKPKLESFVDEMKKSISNIAKINEDAVGITLTTGENLTAFGKGLGIQVFAIVSLIKNEN